MNISSVLAEHPERLNIAQTGVLTVSLLCGSFFGNYVAKLVKPKQARKATLLVAGLGAVMTVSKGVAGLCGKI